MAGDEFEMKLLLDHGEEEHGFKHGECARCATRPGRPGRYVHALGKRNHSLVSYWASRRRTAPRVMVVGSSRSRH